MTKTLGGDVFPAACFDDLQKSLFFASYPLIEDYVNGSVDYANGSDALKGLLKSRECAVGVSLHLKETREMMQKALAWLSNFKERTTNCKLRQHVEKRQKDWIANSSSLCEMSVSIVFLGS